VFGEIKSLEVTIPWTSLLSSPVKVVIDGISLQVGPLSYAQLDKREIREQQIAAKLEQLRVANESIDFIGVAADVKGLDLADKGKKGAATSPNAKATYVQQWTAKIIDNIEITLKNVHFRYEDSQTIPGSIFSAGVTLKSFTLSSCDEKWTEKFVERDLNKAAKVIRKLAKVNNLGLYWMTKSSMLSGKDFVDWSKEMRLLIYSGTSLDGTFFKDVQYFLHPENSLIFKLIHDDSDKCSPKFNISVESSNFLLSVDRSQYLQVQRTLAIISFAEKRRKPVIDRPLARPNNPKSCKIWWKYACKLAVKRQRYILLVKRSYTADEGGHMDIRSEAEKKETRELEIWIPLRSLVIFRHASAKEMHVEAADRHARLVRESTLNGLTPPIVKAVKPEPRTWVSWMTGKQKSDSKEKTETPEEGDVSLESLIASVEQSVGDVGQASPVYDLSVTTSATLNLSVGGSPVVTATMAVTLKAASSSSGITATVHMRDLLVIDKCSSTPIISNIIAVKDKTKGPSAGSAQSASPGNDTTQDPTPSFSVTYENLNGKKVIRVTALPVEFTMNKECIQKLVGFALPSPAAPSVQSKKLVEDSLLEGNILSDSALEKSDGVDTTEKSYFHDVMSMKLVDDGPANGEDEGSGGQFEIIFEAHAPKIIIPQDSSSDLGFFLLDTGYLAVKVNTPRPTNIFAYTVQLTLIRSMPSNHLWVLSLLSSPISLSPQGFMGPKGMSLNVSLRDINIAMPRTLADMNTFKQNSLYLIKASYSTLCLSILLLSTADLAWPYRHC
jgi:Vacuolar sorting-associated protein 13, N-terminal/N-terminal region of Chorein or VPS13